MDWGGKLDDDEKKIDTGEAPYWTRALMVVFLSIIAIVMLIGIAEFLQPIIGLFGAH